ncbi:hypothetical protein V8F06_007405 [Rhypophila decipiens]
MQLQTTISLLALTLCQSVLALPSVARVAQDDPPVDRYVLDYRVFGATGCFDKNLGVGTITSSQLDQCLAWGDAGIKAVNLTNIVDGCSFHVYTEPSCQGHSEELPKGVQCGGNIFDETFSWVSYKTTCP